MITTPTELITRTRELADALEKSERRLAEVDAAFEGYKDDIVAKSRREIDFRAQEREGVERERDDARAELAEHKVKMVDQLADAYDKGRRYNEDEDDRTSEHD